MDVTSVILGSNLGLAILPFNNLTNVIPAVMSRNTIARATAKAEVCLNESAVTKIKIKLVHIPKENHQHPTENKISSQHPLDKVNHFNGTVNPIRHFNNLVINHL